MRCLPRALLASIRDHVIINGEMETEYHPWYGSAATMMVGEIHDKLTPPAK